MLAEEENALLTRTDPGTPGGALLRCYWQPVALAEELPPGGAPLLPAYEALTVPDAHRFVTKYYHECNYLQGNEGEIDPVHTSYLHRQMLGSEGERAFRGVAGAGVSQMSLYARDVAPRIEI